MVAFAINATGTGFSDVAALVRRGDSSNAEGSL